MAHLALTFHAGRLQMESLYREDLYEICSILSNKICIR